MSVTRRKRVVGARPQRPWGQLAWLSAGRAGGLPGVRTRRLARTWELVSGLTKRLFLTSPYRMRHNEGMPKVFDYLLLGGGTSCAYAAVQIRSLDSNGTIALLGEESEPPYDRPPFTKYFLWNDEKNIDDFHSKDESFYPQNQIELLLGKRAVSIDRSAKTIRTEGGESFQYGKLLYALGSEPRRLSIPGGDGAWVLRTAEDSARIRRHANSGASAILIGAGYLGAELACALVGRGCSVTLIEAGQRAWPLFPSETVSKSITGELQAKGVRLVAGANVTQIENGRTVFTEDGQRFEGDFIVAGIGAFPRTELAKASGLSVRKGVLASAQLYTEDLDVFVAGDVVEFPDSNLGEQYRAEHHLHAKATAEHAGRGMAGEVAEFREPPVFFSDVGDLSMNLIGYPERAARTWALKNDDPSIVTEVFAFEDGRAAGLIDLRQDWKAQEPLLEVMKSLILSRADLRRVEDLLSRPGFDLASLSEFAGAE